MKVADLVAELRFEADTTGLEKVEKGTESAGAGTIALGNIIATGVTKLAQLGAAAAKAAVAFAVDLVTGVAEAGDEIAKTSQQLGVNAQELQRVRFAGQRAGASVQSMDKAIRTLTVGLTDAKLKGTGPVAEGLELLGLRFEDLESLGLEDRLKLIADAFGEVGSESERSAIAAKLFGTRAGTELKPLLDGGREAIEALGDRAEALGGVLGDKALGDAERFQDAMLDLQTFLQGVKNTIGAELIPQATEWLETGTDWISQNDQLIQQDIPELVGLIADALAVAVPWIIDTVREFRSFYLQVKAFDDEMENRFGPVWGLAKDALFFFISPLATTRDIFANLKEILDGVLDRLGSVGDAVRKAGNDLVEFAGPDSPLGYLLGAETKRVERGAGARFGGETVARGPGGGRAGSVVQGREAARQAVAAAERARVSAQEAKVKTFQESIARATAIAQGAERAQRRADAAAERSKKRGGKRGGKKKKVEEITGIPELDAALAKLDEDESEKGIQAAGGGASAGTATTINRIDQSFTSSSTFQISIEGADLDLGDPEGTASQILAELDRKLSERDRLAADHFRSTVRI